jgi:hypothetical protein
MYKTTKENVIKIITCTKPGLIHVVRPWLVGDDFCITFKELGYSVINLDMENKAFPERIRDKISRRLNSGCVLTYGLPGIELEQLLPDEVRTQIYMYPNKQTDYYKTISEACRDPYKIPTLDMPPGSEDIWTRYLASTDPIELRRLTKLAHDYMKKQYEIAIQEQPTIVVLV